MCGRFSLEDKPLTHRMMKELKVDIGRNALRFSSYHRACQTVSIIRESEGKRIAQDAIWWLLLEPKDGGFKPSRYTSFNTRYDKLHTPRSAGFTAYRESRCLIPATGFGETEYEIVNGKKKPKFYHNFVGTSSALALGGLFRQWRCPTTGEITTSCSVITRPPHPKLAPYHSKASPLLLPINGGWVDRWLDPELTDVNQLGVLLQPHIPIELQGQQIAKPSDPKPLGETFVIGRD